MILLAITQYLLIYYGGGIHIYIFLRIISLGNFIYLILYYID